MYLAFIVGGLLFLLLGDSRDFDERQQINRGKATFAAMWSFFVYAIIAIVLCPMYDSPIFQSPSALLLIGCTFMMLVYLTVAIVLDAYVPLNFPGIKYLYLVFGGVIVVVLLIDRDATNIITDSMEWPCIALSIVFFWAGALMLIMKPVRKFLDSKMED